MREKSKLRRSGRLLTFIFLGVQFARSAPGAEACSQIWTHVSTPAVRQTTDHTCGPACVDYLLIASRHASPGEERLAQVLNTSTEMGTRPSAIAAYFNAQGFPANIKENLTLDDVTRLLEERVALIALIELGGDGHWVVVTGVTPRAVHYMDPFQGEFLEMPIQEFFNIWTTDHFGSRNNRLAILVDRLF